ncbi:MAG: hypothetical protein QOI20_1433 [Acidimicrobiaceae bacterium]|jgi:hypothetical protein|nr:hypothetical protein [Acidimicrobiaceae bacterium]
MTAHHDRPTKKRWWLLLVLTGALVAGSRKKGFSSRAHEVIAQWLDHKVGWDKLPTPAGLAVLAGLRNILRRENLHDTTSNPTSSPTEPLPYDASFLTNRTVDGSYNDLSAPTMGARHTRFGRNVPIESTWPDAEPDLLEPNPRDVSRELLTRHEFIPATSINVLASSWIQFMVKDWFSHGEGDPAKHYEIPLAADDNWFERPMKILKTLTDTTASDSTRPPTFINTETHWWDTSQIYGTTKEGQALRRSGVDGKLVIGDDGRLKLPDDPAHSPAFVPGWWLGLNLMSTLFIKEHNSVCDALKAAYPDSSDEELFQRARLVVSALVAKIHTVEWTPAIIAHPTTVVALRANWWGVATERVRRTFGRISKSEVISGIAGGTVDHYGVPYSLTEEFTVVYRMHPLTRDDYEFRSVADDHVLLNADFRALAGRHAQDVTAKHSLADLWYSFGRMNPGALVLNNYPKLLQEFQRPDKEDVFMDLAAIDILRAREFGVPRYNEFRRLLHLKPASSFEELTGDKDLAKRISTIYGDDIERVDLMVGMFAEKPPKGFGFSDTAFRIFILMASRRLNSDRFFTDDFNPEVYTPVGYEWVQSTSMIDVLLRHHPELRPALRGVANAFQPWSSVASASASVGSASASVGSK